MKPEDYCSFEVAKLLKEKGFDWMCNGYYNKDDENSEPYFGDGEGADNWNNQAPSVKDLWYSASTHQMAMKWLREIHRKYIDIRYNNQNEEYRFIVFTMVKDKPIDFIHSEYHSTYEEAVEAALKYCLTKLI